MKLSRLAPMVMLLACAIGLSACANTVRGAGKDVKATANAVKDTVQYFSRRFIPAHIGSGRVSRGLSNCRRGGAS